MKSRFRKICLIEAYKMDWKGEIQSQAANQTAILIVGMKWKDLTRLVVIGI